MSKPKIVFAKVTGTGWPIDDKLVYLSQWAYDPDNWHLYAWSKNDDEAIMDTIWQSLTEAGLEMHDTYEAFVADWKAEKQCTDMVFALPPEKVTVIEVQQEAEEDPEEQPPAITPRKTADKGGIALLYLKRKFKDVGDNHPDWQLVKCPVCGSECYKMPAIDKLQLTQGIELMCTECAINAGYVTRYGKKNTPHPDGNRAKRRSKNYKALKRMEKATRRKP